MTDSARAHARTCISEIRRALANVIGKQGSHVTDVKHLGYATRTVQFCIEVLVAPDALDNLTVRCVGWETAASDGPCIAPAFCQHRGFADADTPTDGCSECFVETVQTMTPGVAICDLRQSWCIITCFS